jgi:hypothetical protein
MTTDITNLDTVKAKATPAAATTKSKAPATPTAAATTPASTPTSTTSTGLSTADQKCWSPYKGCSLKVTPAQPKTTLKKDLASYSTIQAGTVFTTADAPGKTQFNFSVQHAETDFYFQFGIGPLCIFCAAVFSIFWGTLAGLLVRRTDMSDLRSIEKCIETYGKTEEEVAIIGGEK